MTRKSKLSEKQWVEIERRLLAGEPGRALAREFGVSETAIRKHCGSRTKQIKAVANQLFEAEKAFKSLPLSSQIQAANLLDELRAVSTHLAGAAKLGSMTAHRLAGIANQQVQMIDDSKPLEDIESLKGIAILTDLSNKAAQTGLNLLAANKERIKQLDDEARDRQGETIEGDNLIAETVKQQFAKFSGVR
jgi:hypothetical protein